MKIFVISWFYPPVTTSEALVTYKLLSNSKYEYYLCCASSKQWSYNKETKLESENIKKITIKTDDFNVFIDKCVEEYKKLSKKIKFDAIMTRSMPPESQEVGLRIKEFDKDVPWITSLADPIGNNPYETLLILQNRIKLVRNLYLNAPHFFLNNFCKFARNEYTKKLGELNKLEEKVVRQADIVIVPTKEQGKFIIHNDKMYEEKCMVVPHSFDKNLYPKVKNTSSDIKTFSFIGHSDQLRSVEPLVRALKLIRDINPDILNNIKVRLVGNIPKNIKNMIYVFFLNDVIQVEEPVDYYTSLKIMEESDYLIHVDANFDVLENGSIFFAAKIADYLGAKKPIIGITNPLCPAGKIITATGGKCSSANELELAKLIIDVMNNPLELNVEQADYYDVKNVARRYDEELERRLKNEKK